MEVVSGPCFEKHFSGNIHTFLGHQFQLVSGRDQVSLFLCVHVHPLSDKCWSERPRCWGQEICSGSWKVFQPVRLQTLAEALRAVTPAFTGGWVSLLGTKRYIQNEMPSILPHHCYGIAVSLKVPKVTSKLVSRRTLDMYPVGMLKWKLLQKSAT